jgi:hypothetical protein
MAWLLRKCAALLVVYSIALQALIGGFLAASHFGIDPFAIICSASSSGGQKHSPPQHRSDCDACLPACGSAPALVPPSVEFSPLRFAEKSKHTPLLAEALSLPSRHQPQASRAPPSILI